MSSSLKELTERQRQILDFIQHRQTSGKLTPTLREIASHFRFSSPNAALAHVQALIAKGVLKTLPGRARALQVVASLGAPASRRRVATSQTTELTGATPALPEAQVISVPIYGAIPAGRPMD